MKFADYINNAWNEHGENSAKVVKTFPEGIDLIAEEKEISQMAQIVLHVGLEHLKSSEIVLQSLSALEAHPLFDKAGESGKTVRRVRAIVGAVSGEFEEISEFSADDQIRIKVGAASIFVGQTCEQDDLELSKNAQVFFNSAIELAEQMGAKSKKHDHETCRSLAISGNNIACSLEEKNQRNEIDQALMGRAAQMGLKYWSLCGTWLNVERAEYRLAKTYLQLNNYKKAFEHAQNCVSICIENSAEPIEIAFAYECLAEVEENRGHPSGFERAKKQVQTHFEKATPEDQSWSRPYLEKHLG